MVNFCPSYVLSVKCSHVKHVTLLDMVAETQLGGLSAHAKVIRDDSRGRLSPSPPLFWIAASPVRAADLCLFTGPGSGFYYLKISKGLHFHQATSLSDHWCSASETFFKKARFTFTFTFTLSLANGQKLVFFSPLLKICWKIVCLFDCLWIKWWWSRVRKLKLWLHSQQWV